MVKNVQVDKVGGSETYSVLRKVRMKEFGLEIEERKVVVIESKDYEIASVRKSESSKESRMEKVQQTTPSPQRLLLSQTPNSS